jgi:hypothetical protein
MKVQKGRFSKLSKFGKGIDVGGRSKKWYT